MSKTNSLISPDGNVSFGLFEQPVPFINYQDFPFRTVTNKPAGSIKRYFSYKQFQYFGAISNDLIFGCALANIRYIGACFAYVYKPSTKQMLTWQFKTPFALGLNMSDRTDHGKSIFKRGSKEVVQQYVHHRDGSREKHLKIDFGEELKINAAMHEPVEFETRSICTPCNVNGWVYAQKTAALKVTGTLSCALGDINLDELDCYGHHDFSAGFMRRDTFWNWACFSSPPADDRPALGLNISWGVNETGYSENCVWVGNKCYNLPPVQFAYDRDAMLEHWHVRSGDGRVDLEFTPEGKHSEELNLVVLATDFHQIFGRFRGHITLKNGEKLEIEELWGFVEHQFSRW